MKLKLLAAAVLPLGAVLVSASDLLGQGKVPLEGNPFQEWNNKTIMIVSPHPDDDIIGCGGALAFLSGRGNRLIVVYLTNGEKGTFDPSMNPLSLAKIRRQEAAAGYRSLGFADARLIWLGYHDGELDFASPRELRIRLTHLIRRHRPDVVFALDPGLTYYRYHYRDHRTAALAVADAIGAAMWPLEFPEHGISAFRVPDVSISIPLSQTSSLTSHQSTSGSCKRSRNIVPNFRRRISTIVPRARRPPALTWRRSSCRSQVGPPQSSFDTGDRHVAGEGAA